MIKFIRCTILAYIFAVFGLGSLIMGLIVFPIIKFIYKDESSVLIHQSMAIERSWDFFLKKFLIGLGTIKVNVKDIARLKNIKNSIIVATHPSYIDVLIILSMIPRTTCFVAPRIINNKFFRNIVKSMFIVSGKEPEEIAKDAKKMLDNGFNILIFPTGTRHSATSHPKIKKGASYIALSTKTNIETLKMTTTAPFLGVGQPFYDATEKPVEYDIEALETINIKDYLDKDEVLAKKELTKKIEEILYTKTN